METDGKAMVKLVPTETLRAARDAKAALVKEKAERKAAAAAAAEQKRLEKLEKGRLSPSEMFKPPQSQEFSEWDESGLPTKDKEGVEVAKSRGKKLKKEWDMQKKCVPSSSSSLAFARPLTSMYCVIIDSMMSSSRSRASLNSRIPLAVIDFYSSHFFWANYSARL